MRRLAPGALLTLRILLALIGGAALPVAAAAQTAPPADDSGSVLTAPRATPDAQGPIGAQPTRGQLRVTDLWPRPPAWDASICLGWRGVRERPFGYPRFSGRTHAGITAGYYWSPHFKTEIEAGASTADDVETGQPVDFDVPGLAYRPIVWTTHRVQDTAIVSVLGLYQFGDDATFHPNVGVGIEMTRSRDVSTLRRQTISTGSGGAVVVLVPEPITTTDTSLTARAVATAGFKAYVTPRIFLRSDVRITAGRSPNNVSARFGAGVDF